MFGKKTTLKWVDDKFVEFGSYPQAANGGVKPILWRVLEKNDGQLLLLSEHLLDGRNWNPTNHSMKKTGKKADIEAAIVPWEKCDLRRWLNNDFFNTAFGKAEKEIIIERLNTGNGAYLHHDYVPKKGNRMNLNILSSDSYETYEKRGCADTVDNVFLLNIEEAIKYFGESYTIPNTRWSANLDRIARPTDYLYKRGFHDIKTGTYYSIETKKIGYYKGSEYVTIDEFTGCQGYWLRNIGSNDITFHSTNAPFHHGQLSFVSDTGAINGAGHCPASMGNMVRPVILVRANSF